MSVPPVRLSLQHVIILIVAIVISTGCGDRPEPEASPSSGTFVITARGLEFEAPSEAPSGWTTFRLVNESSMTHFALVERMPPGIGIDDHQMEVAPVYQMGMDLLKRGSVDSAMSAFGNLPEWLAGVEFVGGPGLLAPGHTSTTTVNLTPGTYLIECYVKTNGTFHSYNPDPDTYGMVHQFRVTDDSASAAEPDADIQVLVSGERGLDLSAIPSAGTRTFSVHFDDQMVHENFVGHDVHLARLESDSDLAALETWMDWTQPGGLETPAPVEFVGGTNEMSAGSTTYFTADLAPGRYALISEVPRSREKGLLEVFVIPSD